MTAASLRLPSFARLPPPGRGVIVAAVLAAVVIAAAVLRVEAAGGRPGHASADERAYVRLASELRATGNYGGPSMAHPLHWAPGAPALFAVADALSGHPAGGRIDTRAARRAQAVVGALTVGAAFALAALIAGAWAGVAAAVAVAFYPPMIAATTQLTSEPLGALAVTAALAAVAWAWSRGRAAGFAVAGAAVGLACLVRADVLLAALVLAPAVGLLHAQRSTWRAGVAAGCATLLGVLAIVGALDRVREPARPSLRADHRRRPRDALRRHLPPRPRHHLRPQACARARGDARAPLDPPQGPLPPAREGLPRGRRRPPPAPLARRRDLGRAAPQPARLPLGHPVAFARMLAAKTWRMWAFPFRGTFRRVGATTIWLHRVLVALALAGLVAGLIRRRSAILGLALLTLGVTAAVDIAFVAEARHAFRLMPALLAAGAGGWALLAGGARASRRPPVD